MPLIRVLSPASARSPITTAAGQTYPQVPGTMLDVDAHIAEFLAGNGWTKVGTVGPTASRPSSSIASTVGVYLAQAGSYHMDTTLGALVIHDGTTWRNPLTGAVA